ncbi:MAG: sulfatase-like hydrolase/transferase [Nitrososphaerota archaeon]|nr:sulfatase-like hydrolase/transferase [Nitrososphaerota archaeon]MDG6958289.1 sulfatase-like hydrolase/transferase [Nitrososphaerota archaeon]MDG6972259.1 sulfatase-like hydrolase/transferase [Nitrososphaerota archaeon]MDG6977365.1 sulfatase-like hydrolase/transferase [Nitrososphaerota archaeon]MDG6979505.1 sulfatase-like hydrolase/transferase [Nitrososphaerota archaeon]
MAKEIVLLLTVDSLRRDHVGCYHGQSLTPFLDTFAEGSTVFEGACSQGGGTPESFRSIMFSLPPPLSLDERHVHGKESIAKVLREAGYATGGFHSNPFLSSHFGYDEGFETFFDGGGKQTGDATLLGDLGNAASIALMNRGPATDGKEITSRALEWAKGARSPAFLWVHYMDTHFPYLPPARMQGWRGSLRNRVAWDMLMARKIQAKAGEPSEGVRSRVMSSYRLCVREVDSYISTLIEGVWKHFDRRLVVMTADHGEGFWEHGRFGHGGVYDEILRVPLIVNSTGAGPGRRVQGLAPLADIKPTILRQAGLAQDGGLPLATGEAVTPGRKLVCASLDPPDGTRTLGFRSELMKYIRKESLDGSKCASEELYDLVRDPGERMDVLADRKEEGSAARAGLEEVLARGVTQALVDKSDESEVARRLHALGYD